MATNKPGLTIGQLHLGGISASKFEGREGTVAEALAIDFQSRIGVIQASQALKAISEAETEQPDERIDVTLACSNCKLYFFSQESGKIWECNAGVWDLVYTTVPTTGAAGALSATEFEGFIYWTTQNYIHRIEVADLADWSTNAVPNWQLFPNTDALYHPMVKLNNKLLIGDGSVLHQVYAEAFTADALDILDEHRISTLETYDVYALIGTVNRNTAARATTYVWNGWSTSWNQDITVPEKGVNAFIKTAQGTFLNVGKTGGLFQFTGASISESLNVPGESTLTSDYGVYPGAVTEYNQKTLFAISNKAEAVATAGIYSYSSSNPSVYPYVLSLEYVLDTDEVGTGVLITSLVADGNTLYVCYTIGATSAVKVIDLAVKQDGAYIATRVAYADRTRQVSGWKVAVGYIDLPEGTSIEIYVKSQYGASWTSLTVKKDAINKVVYADSRIVANVYEWKIVLRTSANLSPVIDEINIEIAD